MTIISSTDLWEVSIDGKEDPYLSQNIYGIELDKNTIHLLVSYALRSSAKHIDKIEQCKDLVIYKYDYNYLLKKKYKFINCSPSGKDWVLNFEEFTETNS